MPTYVYECQRCGHRFELLQGINDPPRQRCPQCQGKVKRVLTPGGGLIFKGTGFYITDYKRKEDQRKEGARKRRAAGPKSPSPSTDQASGKEVQRDRPGKASGGEAASS